MYDIAIIGGGVNGCGIARDAAGRGLKVLLVEKSDLASGTSSASTKLVHGGLRYLEHYEFKLVRDALAEREVLLSMAPHIIWPLRFVLPHHKALRPAWLIRMGLFLYDHLGGRKILPASRSIRLKDVPAGAPLQDTFTNAFEYSDCWVDDARLVVLNAMDAKARGADIRTRTEAVTARGENGKWIIDLENKTTGKRERVTANVLINAAGPWVDDVLHRKAGKNGKPRIRLVKGSHIVVPKLFDHDRAYIFQNDDKRIVFAIPYETDYTLIGTTDVDYQGDPGNVKIDAEEIEYLCKLASSYFKQGISPQSVVWTYSGVRPLMDDGATAAQEATRDYVLELDDTLGAPLLNIFGGKITTYRRLAEIRDREARWSARHRRAMDRRRGFARRGFPRRWRARARARRTAAGADARTIDRSPAGAHLRNARQRHRDKRNRKRHGPDAQRGFVGERGSLPRRQRVGSHGRRYPVAAHEARPAHNARGESTNFRLARRAYAPRGISGCEHGPGLISACKPSWARTGLHHGDTCGHKRGAIQGE